MQAEKLTWSAQQNNDKIALQLAGELSRETLLPLWNDWKNKQRFATLTRSQMEKQPILWDLAQLTRIDSAGFALFCELLNDMQLIAATQNIKNAPKELRTLAELFDLDGWLFPLLQN